MTIFLLFLLFSNLPQRQNACKSKIKDAFNQMD